MSEWCCLVLQRGELHPRAPDLVLASDRRRALWVNDHDMPAEVPQVSILLMFLRSAFLRHPHASLHISPSQERSLQLSAPQAVPHKLHSRCLLYICSFTPLTCFSFGMIPSTLLQLQPFSSTHARSMTS